MARIAGVNLPTNKRVIIALTYIHGIGRTKARYYQELEDPGKIALQRRIKAAFDPSGILNPGVLFPGPPSGGVVGAQQA